MNIQIQSELFIVDGQKVVNVRISNDTIKFLKECVNWFIDGKYGDADDPRQRKLGQELKEELHQIWREMNPI